MVVEQDIGTVSLSNESRYYAVRLTLVHSLRVPSTSRVRTVAIVVGCDVANLPPRVVGASRPREGTGVVVVVAAACHPPR